MVVTSEPTCHHHHNNHFLEMTLAVAEVVSPNKPIPTKFSLCRVVYIVVIGKLCSQAGFLMLVNKQKAST